MCRRSAQLLQALVDARVRATSAALPYGAGFILVSHVRAPVGKDKRQQSEPTYQGEKHAALGGILHSFHRGQFPTRNRSIVLVYTT